MTMQDCIIHGVGDCPCPKERAEATEVRAERLIKGSDYPRWEGFQDEPIILVERYERRAGMVVQTPIAVVIMRQVEALLGVIPEDNPIHLILASMKKQGTEWVEVHCDPDLKPTMYKAMDSETKAFLDSGGNKSETETKHGKHGSN